MIPHLILYGSYLVFPFIVGCLWLWKKQWNRGLLGVLLILSVLFIQARFIEPNIVVGEEQTYALNDSATGTIRAVVYGDMHIGVYRSSKQLQKDVEVINSLNPDVIFMVGDFTEQGITPEELPDAFSAYTQLNAPAYAITGNHDTEQPGHIPVKYVREAIEKNGVNMIDNQVVDFNIRGKQLHIVGLSDIWGGETDYSLLHDITEEQNTIVLAHNPDTMLNMTEYPIDLVLSGHTHAGQVRIPFVYDYFIPTGYPFDHGWYSFDDTDVFVTSGAGVSGFPLRFLNVGVIDAIDIQL